MQLTPHRKKPGAQAKGEDLCLDALKRQSFAAGEAVFREGDAPGALYIVKEGEIKLLKKSKKGEILLGRVGKNAIFGEMAGVDRKPRSATAIAEKPTTCYVVDIQMYEERLKELDPFMRGLFRVLVECVRFTTDMQIKKL